MSKIKITVTENVRRSVTWEIESDDLPYADRQTVEHLDNLLKESKRIHHAVDPELGRAIIRVIRKNGRFAGADVAALAGNHDQTYEMENED